MAKISFRQGIVTPTNNFLNKTGNYVDLDATTGTPVQVTIADGNKDYLFTERTQTSEAWGPFTDTTKDFWLYWEVDKATGSRSFGSTELQPVTSSTAPSSPDTGQMWFDLNDNVYKEWSGSRWVRKVRVLAAKLSNASTLESVSVNGSGVFSGSQISSLKDVSAQAGALVFDLSGNPIYDANGKFFTTEDKFLTGIASGAHIHLDNVVKTAAANEPLSSFQTVELIDQNRVKPATPYRQGSKVIGIVEQGASTDDLVNFVTEGIIYNEDWDWDNEGLQVNDPVYIDNDGTITKNSQSSIQIPVGVVVDSQTIMFAPRLFPQVTSEGEVQLSDIVQSGATNGDIIKWDEDDEQWQPKPDTDTRTNISNNGSEIVSATSDINFNSHIEATDDGDGTTTIDIPVTGADSNVVTGTAGTDGNLIQWNIDGDAVDSSVTTTDVITNSDSIDRLDDVDTTTTSPSTDDVLKWDGSNWVPQTDITINVSDNGTEIVAGISDLDFGNLLGVTDDGDDTVTIDIPATGADSNVVTGTAGTDGNLVQWNTNGDVVDSTVTTTDVITISDSIDRLDDVDTSSTSPSTDDVLKFDGTNWVPQSDTDTTTGVSDGGTTTVSAVSDINFNTRLDVTNDGDGTVTVDIPITGADSNVVTGTVGTDGNLIQWNVDGDAVDSSVTTDSVITADDSIDRLDDVDTATTSPSTDDVLKWDGTNWVPQADTDTRTDVSDNGTQVLASVSDINFNNLLDVTDDTDGTITVDVSGDVITADDSIDQLDDVDTTTTSPSTDDVLKWDGSNWVPQSDTDTRTDVSDDGTTTVSAVSDINFSSYLSVVDDTDGTVTINVETTGTDALAVSGTAGTNGNLIQWNADGDAVDAGTATSNLVLTTSSIDALNDVDTTTSTPSTDDVLKWDGTNWIPQADTDTTSGVSDNGTEVVSGVSDINFNNLLDVTDDTDGTVTIDVSGDVLTINNSIDALNDVDTTTTSPSTDDVLKWDGSNWVPQADTDTTTGVSDNGTQILASVSDINFSNLLDVTDDTDGTVTVDVSGDVLTANSSIDDLDDVDTTSTAPNDGEVLTWDDNNSQWIANNVTHWTVINSATTITGAVDLQFKILADTSGGSFTITLPSSPTEGQGYTIVDPTNDWNTNNLTLDGNGNNIEGSTTFTADTNGDKIDVIFFGSQWIVR